MLPRNPIPTPTSSDTGVSTPNSSSAGIKATDFFVRSPFVLEGMLIGLLGAELPLWLIYGIYNYVLNYIAERFA